MAHTRLVVSPAAWLLAVTCLAGGCGAPEAPVAAPGATTAVLALQPYFRELETVHVSAAGRPLTMLLDTGGGATLVTPDVAHALGCTPFGRDVGHRMTGEAVEFQRCESLELSSGTWRRRIEPVGVFDIGRLLPPELPKLDGVLALDAFEGEVVTLDWAASAITVHAPADAAAALTTSGVPVRIATGDNGRFYSALLPVAASWVRSRSTCEAGRGGSYWASALRNLYRSSSTSSCMCSEFRRVSITWRSSSSSQVNAMSA